jgi:hypothetical protein
MFTQNEKIWIRVCFVVSIETLASKLFIWKFFKSIINMDCSWRFSLFWFFRFWRLHYISESLYFEVSKSQICFINKWGIFRRFSLAIFRLVSFWGDSKRWLLWTWLHVTPSDFFRVFTRSCSNSFFSMAKTINELFIINLVVVAKPSNNLFISLQTFWKTRFRLPEFFFMFDYLWDPQFIILKRWVLFPWQNNTKKLTKYIEERFEIVSRRLGSSFKASKWTVIWRASKYFDELFLTQN